MDEETSIVIELYQRWLASRDISLTILCEEHPHLKPAVQACIDRMNAAVDNADATQTLGDVSSSSTATASGAVPQPSAGGASFISQMPFIMPPAPAGYEIIDGPRWGGMGMVFIARDTRLNRLVALKRMRPDRMSPDAMHRFALESRVTANLIHPSIIPIHLAGDHEGPFYIMKLVTENTLRDAIRGHYQKQADGTIAGVSRDHLRRFIVICQALEFAHQHDVIHRDIKPDNIMLDNFGGTMLMDWGLAKSPEIPADDLLHGGTPGYMPPEQTDWDASLHDARTDVFAMGGVLTYILNNDNPNRPRHADMPPAPKALVAIARKAMQPKRKDRYASAAKLAEDVQNWLDDEPVSAYPDPAYVWVSRWMRRHRPLVASTAAALVLAIVLLTTMYILVSREQRQTSLLLARSNIAEADALATAGAPVESLRRIQNANEIFDRLKVSDESAILAALNVIWRSGSPSLSAIHLDGTFRDAALLPGRGEAIAVDDEGQLRFINLMSGAANKVDSIEFMSAVGISPTGGMAAVGTSDGRVQRISCDDGKTTGGAEQGHARAVTAVRFAPHGEMFATLGGQVCLWKAKAGKPMPVEMPPGQWATALAFAGDDQLIVAHAGGFCLFSTATGSPVMTGQIKDDHPTAIAGTGPLIVTGNAKGLLRIWRDQAFEHEFALHCGPIGRISLSPDATKAWFAAQNGRCGLIDLATGIILRTLAPVSGTAAPIMDVDWAHGLAMTAMKSGAGWTLESWNIGGNSLEKPLKESKGAGKSVAFSKSGMLLTAIRTDGRLATWDLGTGFELLSTGRLPLPAGELAGTSRLSADGSTALPPAKTFDPGDPSPVHDTPVYATPDGKQRATIREVTDSQFRLLSPDGHTAATIIATTPKVTLALWPLNVAAPKTIAQLDLDDQPEVGAFSPDGRWLALGFKDGTVMLLDSTSGQQQAISGTSSVRGLCFAGDTRVAIGYRDGTLRIWSPAHPAENKSVAGAHQADFVNVVASANGDLLFSRGLDGKLCVWTRELESVYKLDIGSELELVAVSPAGDCLIFANNDGLSALHLDFARRIVDANVGSAAVSAQQRALRYLALGRPDWYLDTAPAGTLPWISDADRARALWEAGRIGKARDAFAELVKGDPGRAGEWKACVETLTSLAAPK